MPRNTQPHRHHCSASVRWASLVLVLGFVTCAGAAVAQNAQQIVQTAVNAELAADANDHSDWVYRDHDIQPGKDEVAIQIETPQGSIKRVLIRNGHPLTADERNAESDRISKYVGDAAAQAKRRKSGQHDDEQATELLRMLPAAFIWTVQSQTPELITMHYAPNPGFSPPDLQSRVMSALEGEMVIARDGNRIRTLRGKLSHDVKIGYGILGKMFAGGTFQVERRELAPGLWQITETHVHFDGHALIFKTIGEQEDEVKTEWKPSPAKTLRDAEEFLRTVK